MRHIFYSTNAFLKLYIQENFYDDIHYVWCSEYFDSKSAPRYSNGSLVAPSSDPASIYNGLLNDVRKKDKHSSKIIEQKASFVARANQDCLDKKIDENQRDEIIYIVNNADFDQWRPLIYIIPTGPVLKKLKHVPIDRRASFGNEYIIESLKRNEFDIVEILNA